MLSLRCACYFIMSQCVKALRILSTPCMGLVCDVQSHTNQYVMEMYVILS